MIPQGELGSKDRAVRDGVDSLHSSRLGDLLVNAKIVE